jgi:hypothetical protein
MCAVQVCQWQYTNVKNFLHLHFKQSVSNGNAVFFNVNTIKHKKKKKKQRTVLTMDTILLVKKKKILLIF